MIGLKPLISSWKNAIEASRKARKPWLDTAEVCREFYSGSVGFMWSRDFKLKHFKGIPESKFQITIAKAFEFVSIVGPTLMWGCPGRIATTYNKLDIPPQFWDSPEMGEIWEQEYAQERARSVTRNNLMQHYLNYSPREQPGGGLVVDSQMAIIDACITGRGILKVEPYEPEGGTGTLTGAFYVEPSKFFIDPNCCRANLADAGWVAIEHSTPHWELERRFGWPTDSLKKYATKATKQTATSQSAINHTTTSDTMDMVVWYECFSKIGVGTRFKDCKLPQWHEAFETSVGDYAYICFNAQMNEPLNVRAEFLEQADIEQVKNAFDWPVRYYQDNRWPVAILDFWLQPDCPYPLAPLAMGLGELIFLNIFISSLADRIYQDSLVKAAVMQEVAEDTVSKLLSYQHEVVHLNPAVGQNINELVTYLQRPQVNHDAFRMVEYVSMMFDKRVGLMELMYGLNPGGKVSRTAADANIKGEAVNTRPEFMRTQVEAWQTTVANLERIAAAEHVSGETLTPALGKMGANLWTQLITQEDPVIYMREMRCQIEASSIKKPNKEKEVSNVQTIAASMLPVLQWYAQSTGNTDPLNALFESIGNSLDQDVEGWLLPPLPQQEPDPKQDAMGELEMQKRVGDIQGRDLKNKKLLHEMLQQGQGLPVEALDEIDPEAIEGGEEEFPPMPEM